MPRQIDRPTIVYLATNLVNGKRYIGVTSKSLKHRAGSHWYARGRPGNGYPLSHAMEKYGREMVRFKVVAIKKTFSEALTEEIRLISLWKPEYNLTAGGDGGLGLVVPDHVRKKTSERMKKEGHKVWAASAAAHRRRVICLKDGKVYDSGKEAAAAHGICNSALTLHLKGKNATAAGRVFSYYTGVEIADPLHDDKIAALRKKQRIDYMANRWRRRVVCVTTGIQYRSMRDATAQSGIPYGCLSRILGRRGLKSWHGLKFEYAK